MEVKYIENEDIWWKNADDNWPTEKYLTELKSRMITSDKVKINSNNFEAINIVWPNTNLSYVICNHNGEEYPFIIVDVLKVLNKGYILSGYLDVWAKYGVKQINKLKGNWEKIIVERTNLISNKREYEIQNDNILKDISRKILKYTNKDDLYNKLPKIIKDIKNNGEIKEGYLNNQFIEFDIGGDNNKISLPLYGKTSYKYGNLTGTNNKPYLLAYVANTNLNNSNIKEKNIIGKYIWFEWDYGSNSFKLIEKDNYESIKLQPQKVLNIYNKKYNDYIDTIIFNNINDPAPYFKPDVSMNFNSSVKYSICGIQYESKYGSSLNWETIKYKDIDNNIKDVHIGWCSFKLNLNSSEKEIILSPIDIPYFINNNINKINKKYISLDIDDLPNVILPLKTKSNTIGGQVVDTYKYNQIVLNNFIESNIKNILPSYNNRQEKSNSILDLIYYNHLSTKTKNGIFLPNFLKYFDNKFFNQKALPNLLWLDNQKFYINFSDKFYIFNFSNNESMINSNTIISFEQPYNIDKYLQYVEQNKNRVNAGWNTQLNQFGGDILSSLIPSGGIGGIMTGFNSFYHTKGENEGRSKFGGRKTMWDVIHNGLGGLGNESTTTFVGDDWNKNNYINDINTLGKTFSGMGNIFLSPFKVLGSIISGGINLINYKKQMEAHYEDMKNTLGTKTLMSYQQDVINSFCLRNNKEIEIEYSELTKEIYEQNIKLYGNLVNSNFIFQGEQGYYKFNDNNIKQFLNLYYEGLLKYKELVKDIYVNGIRLWDIKPSW